MIILHLFANLTAGFVSQSLCVEVIFCASMSQNLSLSWIICVLHLPSPQMITIFTIWFTHPSSNICERNYDRGIFNYTFLLSPNCLHMVDATEETFPMLASLSCSLIAGCIITRYQKDFCCCKLCTHHYNSIHDVGS